MSSGASGVLRDVLEERGAAHVGRALVPREAVALGDLEALPALVALEDVVVGGPEHLLVHGRLDHPRDLLRGGPDVLEVDVLAVGVLAERLVEQVDVHRPRQRVRHHQRRRREVVHLHVRVDPALEVAVAGEHGDDREVLGADDVGDLLRQRAGVADAGRAAVADEVEAERLERVDEVRLVVVLHDDLRARARATSSPTAWTAGPSRPRCGPAGRRRSSPTGCDVFVQRRDRGDHDVAVVELGLRAVLERERDGVLDRGRRPARGCRPRPGASCRGRSRCRCGRAGRRPGRTRRPPRRRRCPRRLGLGLRVREDVLERAAEGRLGLGQRHAVLRALRAGERRDDVAEVELERLGVGLLLGVRVVPQALRAGVGLDDLDLLLACGR